MSEHEENPTPSSSNTVLVGSRTGLLTKANRPKRITTVVISLIIVLLAVVIAGEIMLSRHHETPSNNSKTSVQKDTRQPAKTNNPDAHDGIVSLPLSSTGGPDVDKKGD